MLLYCRLFSRQLYLSDEDRCVLEASYIPHAIPHWLHAAQNATSHKAVSNAIRIIHLYMLTGSHIVLSELSRAKWYKSISRFLATLPSSTADEVLLCELLQLITLYLQLTTQCMEDWLTDIIQDPNGVVLKLLAKTDREDRDTSTTYRFIYKPFHPCLLMEVEFMHS